MTTIKNIKADVAYWLRAEHYLEEPEVEHALAVLTRHQWRGHVRRRTDPHALAGILVSSAFLAEAPE